MVFGVPWKNLDPGMNSGVNGLGHQLGSHRDLSRHEETTPA